MKHFIIFIGVLLFAACAQQTQPTGGPKDELPPKLIESNPENNSVNVKTTKVELSFTELIQLNNAREQIIISPSVKDVETTYKKNKVILAFKTPLKDSTTYSINFRDAVQDITEKNPAENLKLAFSTGSYIDSLSISGIVFDPLTGKPLKDVTIALHYQNDTFSIFKHKAEIFTKASEDGKFKIENLKAANFHIYAFADKNKNLIVDGRSEKYGFLPSAINLKKDTTGLLIPLVNLDSRDLKLISARPQVNYFNIRANKPIDKFKVEYPNKGTAVTQYNKAESSIKIFQSFQVTDSIQAKILLVDSLSNQIDTTVYVKFNPKMEDTKLEKFSTKTEKVIVLDKTQEFKTSITFNKPIATINYDSILIKRDSLHTEYIKKEDIKYDSINLTLQLQKTITKKEDDKTSTIPKEKPLTKSTTKPLNIFYLGKGALISIDGDSSANASTKITFLKEEDLSVILVNPSIASDTYLIQLLDSKGSVIQEIKNGTTNKFSNVNPGEYQLRIIVDQNKNGRWDPGNYFKKDEPEKIYYYFDDKGESKFSVKANWEYGPLLISAENHVNNLGKSTSKKIKP